MPESRLSYVVGRGAGGCLLLHGFSGSPLEMIPMADVLADHGWTAGVAELAGHGSPRDLARTGWREWLASAEAGFGELRAHCHEVALIGLSMGGAVALCLATDRQPVAVVTISTPIRMKRLMARASRVAARVVPYVPVLMKLGPRERAMRRYQSPARRIPLRATQEVERLLGEMRDALPRVRVPVLIAQGRRDWVIPRESARAIAAGLPGEARVLWLPRSGHVATLDRDRNVLYTEVAAFLRLHLDGGADGDAGNGGAGDGAAD